MDGVLFTFVCSVFAAFYFISNDLFKVRGDVFVFLRSAFAVLLLLPVVPFMGWSGGAVTYLVLVAAGVAACVGDIAFFGNSQIYSASAMSRIIVFRNVLLFLLWILLIDGYWSRLMANEAVLIGSFLLIGISTAALYLMKKDSIGTAVIAAAVPPLIYFTIADFLIAYAVKGHAGVMFSLSVTFTTASAMMVTAFVLLRLKRVVWPAPERVLKRVVAIGGINGFLYLGMSSTKAVAVALLENPGYFGAMVTIYTLWIYLLHKYWLKRAELADPRLGFIVVLCSVGLGLLSLQIPK